MLTLKVWVNALILIMNTFGLKGVGYIAVAIVFIGIHTALDQELVIALVHASKRQATLGLATII
jgi:hypothetical protein